MQGRPSPWKRERYTGIPTARFGGDKEAKKQAKKKKRVIPWQFGFVAPALREQIESQVHEPKSLAADFVFPPTMMIALGPDRNDAMGHSRSEAAVYVDGSNTPTHAGHGVFWSTLDRRNVSCRGPGTNNHHEAHAVLRALQTWQSDPPPGCNRLVIYSDSVLTINAVTKWFENWRRTFQFGRKNYAVYEQVVDLLAEMDGNVRFEHVKAHQGTYGNEAADALAGRHLDRIEDKQLLLERVALLVGVTENEAEHVKLALDAELIEGKAISIDLLEEAARDPTVFEVHLGDMALEERVREITDPRGLKVKFTPKATPIDK